MDTEPSLPNPESAAPKRPRNVLAGALLGAMALTASVVGVSAVAGAQDDPEVDDTVEEVGIDEGDIEIDDLAWVAFDECIDDHLEGIAEPDVDDESEISDEEWEALDEAWTAAEDVCFDHLPEEAKAEIEAFADFDQCLADAGFGDDVSDDGTFVFVETDEGGQSIHFGDTPGTVTVTGDAAGVSVVTDGGVTVIDEATIDDAYETCEAFLPEGLIDIDDFHDDELDDDDFHDDEHEDEDA